MLSVPLYVRHEHIDDCLLIAMRYKLTRDRQSGAARDKFFLNETKIFPDDNEA
jgi:hypothetical protein